MTVASTEGVPTLRAVGDVTPGPAYTPTRSLPELHRVIEYALKQLAAKRQAVDLLWRYHDGQHPQLWMTEKLRAAFGRDMEGSLQDNYCSLAIEAPLLRLGVTGWALLEGQQEAAGGDATTDDGTDTGGDIGDNSGTAPVPLTDADRVTEVWDANELDLDQDELYRAAMVAGEGFVIAWPRYDAAGNQATTEAGTPLYDVAVNDARNVHLELGTSRRQRLWAVKVWLDTGATGGPSWRANVYYDDELARLRMKPGQGGSGGNRAMPAKANRFYLDEDDPGGPNPMGTVPVFRFARDRKGRSRLTNLVPVQDKINKLAANKMVAAEFLAWGQRVLLTSQDVPDAMLRPAPGAWLQLDPGGKTEDGEEPETKILELGGADLTKYDSAKESEVDTFFTLGMLPRHLRVSPGQPPSGDAIRQDESPFVSVVTDWQDNLGAAWRDLWATLGYRVGPTWGDAKGESPGAVYTAVAAIVAQGCPLDVALRYLAGWDGDQLAELRDRMGEEAKVAAAQQREANRMMQQALDTGALDSYGAGGIGAAGGGPGADGAP